MTTIVNNASPTAIGAAELARLLDEDPSLGVIDVRTGGEFESAHIPGSHNVPLDALGDHVIDLASVDRPVVLVCQSGARSTQAGEKLAAQGKATLRVLEGGLNSWESAGGDVVRGDTERWAMDRQVRLVAGSIALSGIVLSTVVPGAKWIAGGIAGGLTFSAVTDTCAMATMLSKLPYNRTEDPDVASVVAALASDR